MNQNRKFNQRFTRVLKLSLWLTVFSASLSVTPSKTLAKNPHFALEQKIQRAVERGRKSLYKDFKDHLNNPNRGYPMGYMSLYLTALLKAGTPAKDPVVQEAFQMLDRMPLARTYSVACYLFALDAYWQRGIKDAARAKKGGTFVMTKSRHAQGVVRAKMIECLNWLLEARVRGQGVWGYGQRGGWDHSNTQFAILGLQIGLENKIPIDKEVFQEIADNQISRLTKDGDKQLLKLTMTPKIDEFFGKKGKTVSSQKTSNPQVRITPAGFAYTASGKPYASMTAAGSSNLLVARKGLELNNALSPDYKRIIDGAIFSTCAWISNNLDYYLNKGGGHYYYTIYSLEKVGDLGSIQKFDGNDWYRLGAEKLLSYQNREGSWGPPKNTSFALLFLTRATRPHLEAAPPPTILTGTKGDKSVQNGDLVFVEMFNGFISARQFLMYLYQVRNPKLLPAADQVIRNYPIHRVEELIPPLISLWTDHKDRISTWAKKSLGIITGENNKSVAYYSDLYSKSQVVSTMIESKERSPAKIEKIFQSTETSSLKFKILEYIMAIDGVELTGMIIDEFKVKQKDYRLKIADTLERLTEHTEEIPSGNRNADWKKTEEAWRAWWQKNNARLVHNVQTRRLVHRLQASDLDEKTRRDVLKKVIEVGSPAISELVSMLRRSSYRYEHIQALEAITGEKRGLLYEDWVDLLR